MKTFLAILVLAFGSLHSVAQQNLGFDFTIGSPVSLGRPKAYQQLLNDANGYHGFSNSDRSNFSPISPGILVGLMVDTHNGEWKWGLSLQRTAYKTSFGRNNRTQPEEAQYKLRYWSMGFDVAKRMKELEVAGLKTKLYWVSGLYFGSASSEFRIGKDGDWQKQWPYGIAVVYDKTGLISWNNGLMAEVALTDFLFFYPRLSYQLTFSGEKGAPGLERYVGYGSEDAYKRMNRLYLELTVGVRLGEPLKKALSF